MVPGDGGGASALMDVDVKVELVELVCDAGDAGE